MYGRQTEPFDRRGTDAREITELALGEQRMWIAGRQICQPRCSPHRFGAGSEKTSKGGRQQTGIFALRFFPRRSVPASERRHILDVQTRERLEEQNRTELMSAAYPPRHFLYVGTGVMLRCRSGDR